jgi:hypothetical protein
MEGMFDTMISELQQTNEGGDIDSFDRQGKGVAEGQLPDEGRDFISIHSDSSYRDDSNESKSVDVCLS